MLKLDLSSKVQDVYINQHKRQNNFISNQTEREVQTKLTDLDSNLSKKYQIDERILQVTQKAERRYEQLQKQMELDDLTQQKQKFLNTMIAPKLRQKSPISSDFNNYKKFDEQTVKIDTSQIQTYKNYVQNVKPLERSPNQKKENTVKKANQPQLIQLNINNLLIESKQLIYKKNYKEAESLLQHSVNNGVRHSDVFYLLGETKRILQKFEDAEIYLIKALQFDIHSHFVYNSLALTYIELQQFEQAIPLFKAFIQFNQENDTIYFELGKCYLRNKQYLEAAQSFTQCIQINPKMAIYYLHRAESYENLGFSEIAKKDYDIFKELEPNFQYNLEIQAKNHEKSQNYLKAANIRQIIKKLSTY